MAIIKVLNNMFRSLGRTFYPQPTLVVKLETFPEFAFFNCISYPVILPLGSEGGLHLATRISLVATNFISSGGPLGSKIHKQYYNITFIVRER